MTGGAGRSALPTPPLCERCWFPVVPGEPVRRRLVHTLDGAVIAGFEHAVSCTPQEPAVDDAA